MKTVAILKALRAFGPFGSAVRLAAIRTPDAPAIADERGEITYAEFDELINRLANALLDLGLKPGDGIAMLCKNHRAPLVVGFAASRAGLRSLWLNTSFSKRQATEVCEREGVDLLIHDAQFDPDEFAARSDWGHCTVQYAVEVAARAGARRLALFHHDPSHGDDRIDELLAEARQLADELGVEEVVAAAEGLTLSLGQAPQR